MMRVLCLQRLATAEGLDELQIERTTAGLWPKTGVPGPYTSAVSAYLLAVLGGNASPSEADIKKILSSVGVECESERVAALLKEMDGKSLDEVLAAGQSKLASMPAGGGGAAPAAAAAGGAAAAPAAKAKEEEKPESDEDMGFSLFD
eukprot:gene31633-6827_t